MSRTKVMQFIYGLDDGGAETLVKDYTTLIDEDKFDALIVVVRLKGETANLRRVQEANIPVVPIYKYWNVLTKVWHLFAGKWYVPYMLKRVIHQHKVDVIHAHFQMLKYIRKIRGELGGSRLFYTCHNVPSLYFGAGQEAEKRAAEILIKENNLRLIALHRDMADELNDVFSIGNTCVIRNAIDFRYFRDAKITKEEKRRELRIPENAFVLGHVGRFAEQKNQPFLVEVFREVAKINEAAFLVMVGAGDTSEVVSKLAEYGLTDRYMILSHRTDVNEILRTMDVFLFPSKFEGLGIVMIEAQASGLKCIASDAVPKEAIKTDHAISLPLDDAKLWADVILNDGIKGVANGSLDDYDMNKEIRRLEKLYLGEWDQ